MSAPPLHPANDPGSGGQPPVPGAGAPHDAVAVQLWRRWRAGERPDVVAFLAAAGPMSTDRLVAVLEVDQHERLQTGDLVPTETYLHTFPALRSDPRAFSLVLAEMYARQAAGEVVSLADFRRRFPAFELQLGLLSDPADTTVRDAAAHTDTTRPSPATPAPEEARTLRLRPAWVAKPTADVPPPAEPEPVGPPPVRRV